MTTRPHDALFKTAFEAPADAAALLRELMPAAVQAALVWETLGHEDGSFVDETLADQHSDRLFSARLRGDSPTRVRSRQHG
jgi:predicted transposase YdaD